MKCLFHVLIKVIYPSIISYRCLGEASHLHLYCNPRRLPLTRMSPVLPKRHKVSYAEALIKNAMQISRQEM